jgi:hypothetical protein
MINPVIVGPLQKKSWCLYIIIKMENVNQVIADILSQEDISGGSDSGWGGIWGGADVSSAAEAGISGGSSDSAGASGAAGAAGADAAASIAGGKRKLPQALRENQMRVMGHYRALVAKYGKGAKRNGKGLMRIAMEMTRKRSGSKRRSKHSRHSRR